MATLINRVRKPMQYLYCMLMIFLVAGSSFLFIEKLDYRVVAFFLLLTVSVTAVLFDILPVLFTAVLGALVWNFFFIPPRFTFHIDNAADIVLFLMYFMIALVNAVLIYRIRKTEKQNVIKEEKANTIKLYNTLLNSLSHELRTPITTIIGATDNLQNFNSKLSDTNRYELISEISKASFRLNRQVENLLNMSRLESGFLQPKKDWCDVTALIYETVKQVEENTGFRQINIQADPDLPLFRLDETMMEQIIYNLLYNAVIYSGDHRVVSISAIAYADVLEIIIEDNGPGFPAEEIRSVFDKFYRLRNSRAGGTGLGLSIVKGFTEAHNGTVSLQNKARGGSIFTLSIPGETSYLNRLKNE